MTAECPWVAVKDVCHLYGVTYAVAMNKIYAEKFDVPTYKVGKLHVIDRVVHDSFFAKKREEGLSRLNSTKS